jgi:hypothetical protein
MNLTRSSCRMRTLACRPWQYAVVTWQRMQGSKSSPEQLAGFMLKCLQLQQQRMQQQQQLAPQLLTRRTQH